jgi:hypothetical protein
VLWCLSFGPSKETVKKKTSPFDLDLAISPDNHEGIVPVAAKTESNSSGSGFKKVRTKARRKEGSIFRDRIS